MLGPEVDDQRFAVFMQSALGGSADGDLAGFDHLQQHVSDLRGELPARLGADFFEDPVPRACASIGPVAAHRLEGIAGMDDARLDRDLLAAEPVRVATAIPSFMLRADDGRMRPRKGTEATMRSPITGCSRMMAVSSSSSGPGLLRMYPGMPILPMSCNRAPYSRKRSASSSRPSRRPTARASAAVSRECASVWRSLASSAAASAAMVARSAAPS